MSRPPFESLASLLARVAELESALRPFAKLAPMYAGRAAGARLISTAAADVTVGDIREAERTLNGATG